MPHRDFGGGSRDREPVTFTVAGREFEAITRAPAGVLIDAAALAALPEDQRVGHVMEVLDSLLMPESAERMAEALRDPENPVEIPELVDLFSWLVEVYTKRPTPASSPSRLGPRPGGAKSTGASSETE